MTQPVLLRGYRFSVYHRIARMVLAEKGVAYDIEEIDPFAQSIPQAYLRRHPFGRVPVLSHGDFDIFETVAITRYVDAAFDGASLVPSDPVASARMAQVISIIDNYGYGPMVRQVFAHRVFRPAEGLYADETEIVAGMEGAQVVLGALNTIAEEGLVLDGAGITLADCHLAPMMAYFAMAPEGAAALDQYPALAAWWSALRQRDSLVATDPGLPNPHIAAPGSVPAATS